MLQYQPTDKVTIQGLRHYSLWRFFKFAFNVVKQNGSEHNFKNYFLADLKSKNTTSRIARRNIRTYHFPVCDDGVNLLGENTSIDVLKET